MTTLAGLRQAGVAADMAWDSRGLKGAMKAADRSGAPLAVIVGERDLESGVAQVKDMAGQGQEPVALDSLVEVLRERTIR
jgi:histidyl-tRNA synthetase